MVAKKKIQPNGVVTIPVNPLTIAITLDAVFVTRSLSKEIDLTAKLIEAGINSSGFSHIDILLPCVSLNHINTYKWHSDRVYQLDNPYGPTDNSNAYKKPSEWGENEKPIYLWHCCRFIIVPGPV